MILITNLIAWPTAYITSEKVFEHFAYRTHQSVLVYFVTLALMAVLSFLPVTKQFLRAVNAKPIKYLKNGLSEVVGSATRKISHQLHILLITF